LLSLPINEDIRNEPIPLSQNYSATPQAKKEEENGKKQDDEEA
jgi:hypothetical protein